MATKFILILMILSSVAIARSTQTVNPGSEYLDYIVNQPCVVDVNTDKPTSTLVAALKSRKSSRINEISRLIQLQVEMREMIHLTNYTFRAINHWAAVLSRHTRINLSRVVNKYLQLPATQNTGFSAEKNSRLHIILQLSNYASFLKMFENEALGKETATMRKLRLKILQLICTLRTLLPNVHDIQSYIMLDKVRGMFQLKKRNKGIKRVICVLAVEKMLQTFTGIEVPSHGKSVFI